MPLAAGVTLGPYEVLSSLGAGGMGEVYRARDAKLNRDVALKVLLEAFVLDPDRLARFRREAQVLASLNHPNIAAIYGFEDSNPPPGSGQIAVQALVLELVEGPTLADRIAEGPIPVDEALPIARQIAEALEAAHEQGIIHRDLKPANIKITGAGVVKVLDFGLAKAVAPDGATQSADAMNSPTLTARATQLGVILGTAAYMAPEQAKGRPVDRRADIWAFGAVLFEMLAGRRAFGGDDVTEVLASVIKSEPNWEALPADVPPAVRKLLRRCLEKDPKRRLRDIAEGMIRLDEELAHPTESAVEAAAAGTRPLWHRPVPVMAAGVATAVLVPALWMMNGAPHVSAPLRVTLRPSSLAMMSENPRPHIGLTPDGSVLFRAGGYGPGERNELVLKRPDRFEAEPLAGADSATTPFVSPDGEWIGFVQARPPDNLLYKVPIRGGPRTLVATSPVTRVFGAAWAPDNTIVFGTVDGLFKIPPGTDTPVPLTTSGGQHTGWHVWPTVIGSTGLVVFTIRRADDVSLAAVSLSTGVITPLQVPGTYPRYLPTGHLAYATTDGVIRAVPFDATRVAATGPSIPMESGVYVHRLSGAAEFDVSTSGTLAYISAQQERRALVWVDRNGNDTAIPADAGFYTYPRLSPDDLRLSVGVRTSEQDIFTWEFARPGLRPLVRNTAAVGDVLWAKDGTIMYAVTRDGKTAIYRQNADGTGQAFLVVTSDRPLQPLAIVPDGSALVVRQRNDIGVVSLSGNGNPQIEILVSGVSNATLSPNGAWLAYESEDRQVIVKPFPRTNDGSWTISSGAGLAPLFSRDGRELFYLAPGKMMSARVIEGPTFSTAAPKELFPTGDYVIPGIGRTFDVAANGRFLMMKPVGRPDPAINVVFNWFGEVAARVKAR